MWFNILKLEPHNKVYQKRVIETLERLLSPLLTNHGGPIVEKIIEESESDYEESADENAGPHRAADITGMYIHGYNDIKHSGIFGKGVIRLKIQGKYYFDSSRDYAYPRYPKNEQVSGNNYLAVSFAEFSPAVGDAIRLRYSLYKYDLNDIPQMIKDIRREIMSIGRMFIKFPPQRKRLKTLEMFRKDAAERIFYRGFKLTTNKL